MLGSRKYHESLIVGPIANTLSVPMKWRGMGPLTVLLLVLADYVH